MRVLVVGGSGLIGRALIRVLIDAGHSVDLLTRSPDKVGSLPTGVAAVRWDGASPRGWESEVAAADAVVNLAGEGIADAPWTADRKRRIRDSRVQVGRVLVEAIDAANQRPGVLVQASAVDYYGPRGAEPVSETDPPGQDFLAGVCVDWEASTLPVEALGVRRVVIRTGVVLDATRGALPRMAAPVRAFVGGPLGSGRQGVAWIHVTDTAAAIQFLLENAACAGAYNLTAPAPVDYARLAAGIGRALHRPHFVRTPEFAVRALFGEMATVLLSGQFAFPTRLLAAGFRFRYQTLDAALADLLQ